MKCFAAQYVYIGLGKLLTRQVVCVDEGGCIQAVRPLKEESASTVFFNGILCRAFGLPGNNKLLTPDEATSLLFRIRQSNQLLPISDILDFYTEAPDLKIGSKISLWCIEPVDLKNLLLKNESSVYSVLP